MTSLPKFLPGGRSLGFLLAVPGRRHGEFVELWAPPADVIKRYKSLADIERGFRVLKSEIEIGPIHHRLPERIRAHATICFIALILYRVMRSRLHASHTKHSPERALAKPRRIQHHRVSLNESQPMAELSFISQEHADNLAALSLKKPNPNVQLTLL